MSGPTSWSAADARILDTNVLLYAYDALEPLKRPIARKLLGELLATRQLCLSAQILNEFFWNATRSKRGRGRAPILSFDAAGRAIRRWCKIVPILAIDQETTLAALDAMSPHAMSFWDALVWASAKRHGVPVIYTEDYQAGRSVEGVQYIDPFASGSPRP
jgi:predicted nucleic acid-binding protein